MWAIVPHTLANMTPQVCLIASTMNPMVVISTPSQYQMRTRTRDSGVRW